MKTWDGYFVRTQGEHWFNILRDPKRTAHGNGKRSNLAQRGMGSYGEYSKQPMQKHKRKVFL